MQIGYIGIGTMGEPMALNLLKAGHQLTVSNRTLSKCDNLKSQGAQVVPSCAQVAQNTEVIFINVMDTPDVEKVIFGEQGIFQTVRQGQIVIDNSTISPQATREFAERLKTKKIDYLDAPVSGGDIGAQQGTLSIMVGGEKKVFERCRKLFECLGSKITHVGPVGMGQTAKACNQLICAIHMVACCEGIALARQAGLDPKTMVEVVGSGAGASWALSNLGMKIVADDMAPGFRIDLMNKDLRLAMELAQAADLPLPGAGLAQQEFISALAKGHGQLGTQALSKIIEGLGHFKIKD